jgi:hypothetical protein
MSPKLSDLEAELLRKVLNGEAFTMPSYQRVRLELLGFIRDGASGLVVTPEGKRLAATSHKHEPSEDAPTPKDASTPKGTLARDRRGRRLPFQRKAIF